MDLPTSPMLFAKFSTSVDRPRRHHRVGSTSPRRSTSRPSSASSSARPPGGSRRPTPWPRPRLHVHQRRVGARPPVRGQAVRALEVARHVLPDGPCPRDRRRDRRPRRARHRSDRNGVVMQDSSTAQLVFGVAALVAFCSRAFTLEPGDVIATGTPAGVGWYRDPKVLLGDGDVVGIEIEGIGRLENPCRTWAAPARSTRPRARLRARAAEEHDRPPPRARPRPASTRHGARRRRRGEERVGGAAEGTRQRSRTRARGRR